jgi:hypothetical protein
MTFSKGNQYGKSNKGRPRTKEWLENQRKAKLGKHYSPGTEFKKGAKTWNTGKTNPGAKNLPHSFKKGQKPWNAGKTGVQTGVRGEKSHLWKGGLSSWRIKIYNSTEYKIWRKAVFERDKYTCVWCLEKGGKLNADHIKPFAFFPELRFAIDNGRTLCVDCHKKTDSWGHKANKNYGK